MKLSQPLRAARSVIFESLKVYGVLLKIMIPTLIVVKVLQELGAMQVIGSILAPVMSLTGLPPELGIVWATTLLTNMVAGIVVFIGMAGELSLTQARSAVRFPDGPSLQGYTERCGRCLGSIDLYLLRRKRHLHVCIYSYILRGRPFAKQGRDGSLLSPVFGFIEEGGGLSTFPCVWLNCSCGLLRSLSKLRRVLR